MAPKDLKGYLSEKGSNIEHTDQKKQEDLVKSFYKEKLQDKENGPKRLVNKVGCWLKSKGVGIGKDVKEVRKILFNNEMQAINANIHSQKQQSQEISKTKQVDIGNGQKLQSYQEKKRQIIKEITKQRQDEGYTRKTRTPEQEQALAAAVEKQKEAENKKLAQDLREMHDTMQNAVLSNIKRFHQIHKNDDHQTSKAVQSQQTPNTEKNTGKNTGKGLV